VVKFEYQKFSSDTIKLHEVEPLLLKEFRNRWYLLGVHSKNRSILTYGLERMGNLKLKEDKHFKRPAGFNPADYFKNYYGITLEKGKPQKIILSFTPHQGMYIKTQPIHDSQQIIIDNNKELRISLFLVPNYDLFMQIRSYGADATVMK
jgi:predicted DNA-binding transcriptional regulator YafY